MIVQNDLILKLEQSLNDILDFNPKDQQEAEEIEQLKKSIKRQIKSLRRQKNHVNLKTNINMYDV